MDSLELLPCPFCGKDNKLHIHTRKHRETKSKALEIAAKLWNTRMYGVSKRLVPEISLIGSSKTNLTITLNNLH